MSLGIAALRVALKSFSGISDFDFQVEETHHKQKKDSPSGTAILIQSDLENILHRKLSPPISIRAGGVVGEHKITAYSNEEILELRRDGADAGRRRR
jgi:4-hydroxy-tetrahydrodipicolinate reductase